MDKGRRNKRIMSFPDTIFGICQVCGSDGRDQTENLTGADAEARDTTGNGVELEKYKGRYLCPICIKEEKARESGRIEAYKHAEAERFRQQSGFTNTVE